MKRVTALTGAMASLLLLFAAAGGIYSTWLAHKNELRAIEAEQRNAELQRDAEQEQTRLQQEADAERARADEIHQNQLVTGTQIAALTELVRQLATPGRPDLSEEAVAALDRATEGEEITGEQIVAIAQAAEASPVQVRPSNAVNSGTNQQRITYYQKQADGSRVSDALQQANLQFSIGKSSLAEHFSTNSIACSADADPQTLQRLIAAMVAANVPIQTIYRFRSPTKAGIEVLATVWVASDGTRYAMEEAPIPVETLMQVSSCPVSLRS